MYTPILPLMVEDLGMTQSTAGVLASANFAGYLAGALLAATSVVAGSRRRWLLAGLTAAFGLGQIVGPAFAGLVHDAATSFVLPSLTAVAGLLVGALLAMTTVDRRDPADGLSKR